CLHPLPQLVQVVGSLFLGIFAFLAARAEDFRNEECVLALQLIQFLLCSFLFLFHFGSGVGAIGPLIANVADEEVRQAIAVVIDDADFGAHAADGPLRHLGGI